MKTLYESLLGDMETNLNNGDKIMIDSLKIPKIKDFEKNKYNKDQIYVDWYLPNISQVLKKYPNLASKSGKDYTALRFILDDSVRMCFLDVALINKIDDKSWYSTRHLYGWHTSFAGSNLNTYKKMTIKIIEALAKNPKLLDEFLSHADLAEKHAANDKLGGFGKYEIKNLYDLTHK
jgi:hypothetical protein